MKDSGDSGDTSYPQCEQDPIISASEWAGEKGGVSCTVVNSTSLLLLVFSFFLVRVANS